MQRMQMGKDCQNNLLNVLVKVIKNELSGKISVHENKRQ
jgi:hypothetical protein